MFFYTETIESIIEQYLMAENEAFIMTEEGINIVLESSQQ